MKETPSLPPSIWQTLAPEAQAAVSELVTRLEQRFSELQQRNAELQQRNAELQRQVRDLQARLEQDSSNSSKPPSSDPIGVKRRPPASATKKRRGGQEGHPRNVRALAPPEQLTGATDCKPSVCRSCGHALSGDDPEPRRHQVAELPPIQPDVHEYRLHRLRCPQCQTRTSATLPEGVPQSSFGPRLHALFSVLTGVYRLSKRQAAQMVSDVLGLSISSGMVAKLERATAAALEAPMAALERRTQTAKAVNVDETGWRETSFRSWLWVVVGPDATVFHIDRSRSRPVLEALLGDDPKPIATSDRFSVYNGLPTRGRQVCWAHLRRDFQAMIDRDNDGSPIGEALLEHAGRLFRYWHRIRDGTLSRAGLRRAISRLRPRFRASLEGGVACGCAKTAATCEALLFLWDGLWTFARVEGVEPTNNAAERALRHAVLWRRTSGGTASASGSRFVERLLSVRATCRQQGRDVLEYLRRCHESRLWNQPAPSL